MVQKPTELMKLLERWGAARRRGDTEGAAAIQRKIDALRRDVPAEAEVKAPGTAKRRGAGRRPWHRKGT